MGEVKMKLSDEQNAIRNGSKGEVMSKVMETVIRYGELFGAESVSYTHLTLPTICSV